MKFSPEQIHSPTENPALRVSINGPRLHSYADEMPPPPEFPACLRLYVICSLYELMCDIETSTGMLLTPGQAVKRKMGALPDTSRRLEPDQTTDPCAATFFVFT